MSEPLTAEEIALMRVAAQADHSVFPPTAVRRLLATLDAARPSGEVDDGVCSYCNVGQHADCSDFDCRCDYKPDNGHGPRDAARDRPGLDVPADREALWEKFTAGEKLAYGCGYRDAAAQQREGAGPRWTVGVDEFGEEHIDAARDRAGTWMKPSDVRAALDRDRPGLDVERLLVAARAADDLWRRGELTFSAGAAFDTAMAALHGALATAQQREGAGEHDHGPLTWKGGSKKDGGGWSCDVCGYFPVEIARQREGAAYSPLTVTEGSTE